MGSCVAYGCKNRSAKKPYGITFHSFPKNEERRKLWVIALRRENWNPTKHSRICSAHFREEMIDRTSLSCVRLRENAVPIVNKAFPQHLQKKEPKPRKPRKAYVNAANLLTIPHLSLTTPLNNAEEELQMDEPNNSASPTKSEYKRKIDYLVKLVDCKNKKIKVLQQKNCHYKKQIRELKGLFNDLNETNEEFGMLETVPNFNKEFLSSHLSRVTNHPMPQEYSPELRAFALTLHSHSPEAYEFVRQSFNLALPSQRTLSSLAFSVKEEPCEEV